MTEPTLYLFNTLTGRHEAFAPLEHANRRVKMYVCGPTVYDEAHLGHARCYITWDVLVRFLKFLNYDVTYVRNVTDVDDKILNRAKDRQQTPAEVAHRNYESFTADMQALNVLPPDEEPKATAYIAVMIQAIQDLIAKDAAYVTPEGTVYFRVAADPNYGELSKKPLDDLKSGARVEVDPHKENPLDFALWKHVPAEERTDEKLAQGYCFASPWGRGRPGWHIECSAMNYALLGPQIDIHAGGADLIFPHHENEIAQSETWHNLAGGGGHPDQRFAKYWLHNGFVNVSGEKMSKSLGNFSTIKKVLERYDANTIRYFLLTNHYRMPVDFNEEAVEAAENWTHKLYRLLQDSVAINSAYRDITLDRDTDLAPFVQALTDDLGTPKALAILNKTLDELRQVRNQIVHSHQGDLQADMTTHLRTLALAMAMLEVLGFRVSFDVTAEQLPRDEIRTIYQEMTGKWLEPDQEPSVLLAEIVAMRKTAKATKNWTQADAIRKHLADIGLQLLDNKDGTTIVEKDGLEIVRV